MGLSAEWTDEEVVQHVRDGELELFAVLVERYEQKMLRYARRFLIDVEDAKDLVQEVFIKAYMNLKSFDASRSFSPWLYRIAHNSFINAIKKKKSEKIVSLFEFDTLLPHPASRERTEDATERHEIREQLERCLRELAVKYREPLVLYYFEELEYGEIADILRIPISTVGVRLSRGKAMLKKVVEKNK